MGPKKTTVVNGVTIGRQPPIVGDYCKTPDTWYAWNSPCGKESTLCHGGLTTCPRCKFDYCERHFAGHVKPILAPRKPWRRIMKELWQNMEKAAQRGTDARVRVPQFTPEERAEFMSMFFEDGGDAGETVATQPSTASDSGNAGGTDQVLGPV